MAYCLDARTRAIAPPSQSTPPLSLGYPRCTPQDGAPILASTARPCRFTMVVHRGTRRVLREHPALSNTRARARWLRLHAATALFRR